MVIEKALRMVALGGIFALPFIVFIVAQTLFFPFITGKNFTFRIIVEVITGAWLALTLVNPAYRPKRSWLLGAFAVFVLVVALADALGVYPFKSFWSNYERMDGFVTLAHLFAYFTVAYSMLTTEKLWRAFWNTSLGVSVLLGVHGLLQLVGVTSLNPGFSSTARIDATLGNPIYLAAFMLFHIGMAALLFVQTRREFPKSKGYSYFYSFVILFDTLILLLTSTRGTILGLVVGCVLALALLAITSPDVRRKALLAVVGLCLLGGAIWTLRDQAFMQKVPFLQRLTTISVQDGTTKARFYNWGMALQGAKERPILGWGQENYAIVFDKYYDPRMYGQEQWFDRVHNIVFDWLVAAGFVGLFSYLSLFVFALWVLWRKTATQAFSSIESSILTGLLAAYFFHNLFVFDNITSYALFASVLAYIAWRGSAGAAPLSWPTLGESMAPFAMGGAVVLVWGVAWSTNAHALAANRALLQALAPHQEGIQKNLEYFKTTIGYGSFGTQEAREQLVQAAAQIIQSQALPIEVKQAFLNLAVEEMSRMMQESPLDARFPLFLGALLNASGNYKDATAALHKAHELSPGKQMILFELAASQIAEGDTQAALAAYKQAFELEERSTDSRIFYAAAAIRFKQDALADELLAPLIERGEGADVRIAAAYVTGGHYDKIIPIWEKHIEKMPEDANAYYTLAAAYYGAKNSARAITTLQKLEEIAPGAKEQAEALIKQIREGTAKLK